MDTAPRTAKILQRGKAMDEVASENEHLMLVHLPVQTRAEHEEEGQQVHPTSLCSASVYPRCTHIRLVAER